jgi:large subunit ribosomal protein L38
LKLDDCKVNDARDLSLRNFKTFDFYRDRQDEITPAGLGFFQADWDSSLTDFYHNELKMKEPMYDYGPPPPLKFPNAHFHGNEPSWLKTEIMKKRLRWGRINDVEE